MTKKALILLYLGMLPRVMTMEVTYLLLILHIHIPINASIMSKKGQNLLTLYGVFTDWLRGIYSSLSRVVTMDNDHGGDILILHVHISINNSIMSK